MTKQQEKVISKYKKDAPELYEKILEAKDLKIKKIRDIVTKKMLDRPLNRLAKKHCDKKYKKTFNRVQHTIYFNVYDYDIATVISDTVDEVKEEIKKIKKHLNGIPRSFKN